MMSLFEPLTLARGRPMKNRFLLAPMTNQQAHHDGTLTDDELNWLRMRAEGDFSLVMTCCSHVHSKGQGFPGELGVYDDGLLPGLERLADALRNAGAVSSVQLYHGGIRSIMPDRMGPSAAPDDRARAMTTAEVRATIEDFIVAALRAERAGFDGVELHGAHGYLISAFLSGIYNRREDDYGGTPAKRRRFLLEIVAGIRERCGKDFQVGVRVSPEHFGQDVGETRDLAQQLTDEGRIDYLDISLWDVFKNPADPKYQGRSLMSYFTDLNLNGVRLGFAGKIKTHSDATRCLEEGADFVVIGRAAIAHYDLPRQFTANPGFIPRKFPVTADYLRTQGLGESFIAYLATWPDMVTNYFVSPEIPLFDVEEFFTTGRSVKLPTG